jgi:sarcosine oxidase
VNDGRDQYDVIVLGVGGMGSAACYHLARRGLRVLGLERFDIPHTLGSSHGVTRIIRLAYYEHPSYVPLLRRAYELWRELEAGSDERLLFITGSIDAGGSADDVFAESLRSAELHGLPHEVLTSAELSRRFPGYRLPLDHLALFQREGGFLAPERCIVAHVEGAQRAGAEIHGRERVLDWERDGEAIRVTTDRASYRAARLVVCAGAWIGKLVPELAPLARPERQVLAWFQPRRPDLFRPEGFPVFNLAVAEGRYYGFPAWGVPGFKVGRYRHLGEVVDPDELDREPTAADEALLREFTARYFPDAAGPTMALRVCLFTNTPDEHFVVDRHPTDPRVILASPCSGHGFKFCSVIGEVLADLAERGETRHDVGLFRLDRLAGAGAAERPS